ncbi:hypothetical protein [Fluviispira vulneris]|uniref:hypothetical protein n=1 Tax=Fluviispira vulneris TaxID=2763012 RepID=UPI001645238F|nr:hypothetical protein [Fluviispira vulneris]
MILLKAIQKNFCHLIKLSLVYIATISTQAHSSLTYCSTLCGLLDTTVRSTSPDEARVYCSSANKEWAYLGNGNVKVTGTWKQQKVRNFYKIYFIIDGGESTIFQLQRACKNEFGEDFIFAQPDNPRTNSWHTFAINDNIMALGHYLLQLSSPGRL